MKKIINNKVYDTETAALVGEWDNGRYGRDFERCSEELYRKKTGEYFLFGEGGPMSKYAVHRGNETSGGEKIIPLNFEEAKEWAEKKLEADEYEKTFGKIEETEDKVHMHIYINANTAEKLRRQAGQLGKTLSEYVENLLA